MSLIVIGCVMFLAMDFEDDSCMQYQLMESCLSNCSYIACRPNGPCCIRQC